MMGPLLRTEFLKIKRKGFWLLTFLGPFGVVALQMVNYGVRKDYLFQQSDDRWAYYLHNVHDFTPLALVLGIVILTSLMASIENETNAWKQLMSLPVSKYSVYLSKFTVLSFFLLAASFLLMVFTLLYGIFLDLGPDIPYADLARYSFYPFFASLPVLALQLWAAVISKPGDSGGPWGFWCNSHIFFLFFAGLADLEVADLDERLERTGVECPVGPFGRMRLVCFWHD